MTANERLIALATASPATLEKVDVILAGGTPASLQNEDLALVSVTQAARMLDLKYHTFRNRVKDGLFDTVTASGKTMIRRQSVIEYAQGLRKPSEEVLRRREEKNALRRERYRQEREAKRPDQRKSSRASTAMQGSND